MGVFAYNFSASPSAEAPTVRRFLGSTSTSGALNISPERRQIPTSDDNIDTEG